MTEYDDDDDAGAPNGGAAATSNIEIPGDGSDSGLQPVRTPPIHQRQPDQGPQIEFEAYEDDEGQPQDGAGEGRMSEQDGGPQTFVDQQQQDQQADRARRETRAQRTQRQKAARDRDREVIDQQNRKIRELQAQVHGLASRVDPRLAELGANQLRAQAAEADRLYQQAENEFEAAETAYLDALEAGDRSLARSKGRERDELAVKRLQMRNARDMVHAAVQNAGTGDVAVGRDQGQRQAAPVQNTNQQPNPAPRLTSAGERLRDSFLDENPWLDTGGSDTDSRIIMDIDAQVAAEGFNMNTAQYWDEVRKRASRYLPHRFDEADDDGLGANGAAPAPARTQQPAARQQQPAARQAAPRRAAPPSVGPSADGGMNRNSGSGTARVRITPERKQALMDAGILNADASVNDTAKYRRALQRYHDFDLANPPSR